MADDRQQIIERGIQAGLAELKRFTVQQICRLSPQEMQRAIIVAAIAEVLHAMEGTPGG